MKHFSYYAAVLSLAAFASTANAGVLASYDFNTDQSSLFSVQQSGNDYVANFNYDHSTWSPQTGTTGPSSIPSAPNGTGTKALRLEVNNNDAVAAVAAVSVFPNAAAALSNYTLQFDAWMQYNGGATGAGGSTEFLGYGANSPGTQAEWVNSVSSNAILMTMTGEGGAAGDYRYYQGTTRDDARANYNGANEVEASNDGWLALFPSPNYEHAGAPGKNWITIEMVVNNGTVTVSVTPIGGTKTQVASFSPATPLTSGYPFISYFDTFTSISTPKEDVFMLVDNIVISTPDAGVQDWQLFQ